MTEHVILVAGAAGSGKSTAIATLFAADAERAGTIEASQRAVDFGQLELAPGEMVRVYGVPAHASFDYMWQILKRRALGVLVLVRATDPDPVATLLALVDEFAALQSRGGVLVGMTHAAGAPPSPRRGELEAALRQRFPALVTPVLTLDPGDRGQLVTALSVLAASVDSRGLLDD